MSCIPGLYCPFFQPETGAVRFDVGHWPSMGGCPGNSKQCILGKIYNALVAEQQYEISANFKEAVMSYITERKWASKAKITAAPSPLGTGIEFYFPGRPPPSLPGIPNDI